MKRIISILVVFCFVFGAVPLLAQQTVTPENPNVRIIKSEETNPVNIASTFSKAGKSDQELIALDSQLKREGFSPEVKAMGEGNKPNFWGHRDIYHNNQTDEDGSVTISIQNYSKSNSKDSAALVQIRFSVGDRSQVYSCSLIARSGDFQNMEEYKVDNNLGIVKASSWWSCVQNYIRTRCAAACWNAFATCANVSSVLDFVKCVVRAAGCGACPLASMACCGCDCSWWCRWAAGCCNR